MLLQCCLGKIIEVIYKGKTKAIKYQIHYLRMDRPVGRGEKMPMANDQKGLRAKCETHMYSLRKSVAVQGNKERSSEIHATSKQYEELGPVLL